MEDYPTPDQLKALRVVDLRQKLSKAGLPQGGVKADLIQRLSTYYEKLQQQKEEEEELSAKSEEEEEEEEEMADKDEAETESKSEEDPHPIAETCSSEKEESKVEEMTLEGKDASESEEKATEPEEKASEPEGKASEPEQAKHNAREPQEEAKERTSEEEKEEAKVEPTFQPKEEPAKQEAFDSKEEPAKQEAFDSKEESAKPEASEPKEESAEQEASELKEESAKQEEEIIEEEKSRKENIVAELDTPMDVDQKEISNTNEGPEDVVPSKEETTITDSTTTETTKVEEKSKREDDQNPPEDKSKTTLIPPSIDPPPKIIDNDSTPLQPPPPTTKFPKARLPTFQQQQPSQQQSSMMHGGGDDDDLDGPPTPAGPLKTGEKKKGPVPLMSLSLEPPPSVSTAAVDENLKLPKALEEALAFKKERALQVGVSPTDIERVESEGRTQDNQQQSAASRKSKTAGSSSTMSLVGGVGGGSGGGGGVGGVDEDTNEDKKEKGKRHKKKKKKKKNRPEEWAKLAAMEEERRKAEEEEEEGGGGGGGNEDVEVEYIQEKIEVDFSDPKYRQFAKVFEAFKIAGEDEERAKEEKEREIQRKLRDEFKKVPKLLEEDDLVEDMDDDDTPKLSKRKLKKLNRLSVAELKQLVSRPDVVEMHDVTAWDPRLLVHLKSTRNTVPVPRHWCFKRKYLQGKRGIEKPPFDLPDFIKKTGIMEMRAALQEKEESKGLKSKMREKVRPKLGKIDIDYQKLHDAFFKWQTKPRMTGHGDLYYEGKEFEIRLKEKKPGDLSDDLRTALGMPVGPNAHKVPPPWLIAMQRYGPPPSYPNLKIPGLNAPIPDGCSFGYHAGGWGKPPVDELGKPLYGDVFGTSDTAYNTNIPVEEIDRSLWGELESESEDEEESEEEEEGEEGAEEGAGSTDKTGMQTPVVDAGLATPSGMSSVGLAGQETPELLELRKKRIEADMESADAPNLYTILAEKRNERVGGSMMGSTHTYDLTGQGTKAPTSKGPLDTAPVELALNPEEVDLMDTEAMQIRAEAAIREQQASLAKEDLSDMVAEHAAKQSNKRKRLAAKDENKSSKKYKEFKF